MGWHLSCWGWNVWEWAGIPGISLASPILGFWVSPMCSDAVQCREDPLGKRVLFWELSHSVPVFPQPPVPAAAAFRALLQIRAMRKKLGPLSPTGFNPIISSQTSDSEEHSVSAHGARLGYVGPPGQGLVI